MLRQIILVFLTWLCLFGPTLTQAQTALGQLAASMQAGTWAELATNNINAALAQTVGGATGMILPYSEGMVWDPGSRQVLFIGSDHIYVKGSDYPRFVRYSADTNTWQVMSRPSWFPSQTMHAYDHNAINPAAGLFYHRQVANNTLHRYDIRAGTWTDLPALVIFGYPCCDALAHFPELGGLVFSNDIGLYFFNETTRQWRTLATGLSISYHNFAEYNPIHKVVVFGGGNDTPRKMYRLDSTGQVTALKDAPLDLEIPRVEFTVDPVSGDYLVFTRNQEFYTYDILSDKWQLMSGSVPIWIISRPGDAVFTLSAAPISSHGVVMVVTCDYNCKVYLYKHSRNTSPADSIPPAAPTSLLVK